MPARNADLPSCTLRTSCCVSTMSRPVRANAPVTSTISSARPWALPRSRECRLRRGEAAIFRNQPAAHESRDARNHARAAQSDRARIALADRAPRWPRNGPCPAGLDPHALDRARHRAHATADVRAFVHRTGRAGRGRQLAVVRQHHFAVGADVDQELRAAIELRAAGEQGGERVATDVTRDRRKHEHARTRQHVEAEVARFDLHAVGPDRQVRPASQRLRIHAEQDVLHGRDCPPRRRRRCRPTRRRPRAPPRRRGG